MFWIDRALVKGIRLVPWQFVLGLRCPSGWRYRTFWKQTLKFTASQLVVGIFLRLDKVLEALRESAAESCTGGATRVELNGH